jgi:hypothetical protein
VSAISTLRPGERPPLPQIAITPAGLSTFICALAAHAPALEAALTHRPRELRGLAPQQRDGIKTQLRRLRDLLNATLGELGEAAAGITPNS